MFLIGKSVTELHSKFEGKHEHKKNVAVLTLQSAIIQILLIDIIFSLDSILTAIGLLENVLIIIIAVVISLAVMLLFVNTISNFIEKHPAMKILAVSFLILITTLLVVEGLHVHVPRGYIYFSMAFALGIEILNMNIRKRSLDPRKINLHGPIQASVKK